MRTGLGLVACVFLASGLAAAADTAPRLLFKQNGDLCTAEEVANPRRISDRGRAPKGHVCRTKLEWTLIQARQADYDLALARYQAQMTGGSTGEGGLPSTPLRRR